MEPESPEARLARYRRNSRLGCLGILIALFVGACGGLLLWAGASSGEPAMSVVGSMFLVGSAVGGFLSWLANMIFFGLSIGARVGAASTRRGW